MVANAEREHSGQEGPKPTLTPDVFMAQRFGDPRPHFAGRLEDILNEYGVAREISPNLTFGIYKFVKKWNVQSKTGLSELLNFTDGIHKAAGNTDFYKSNSFNYISDKKTLPEVLDDALDNARTMAGIVGPEFFARDGEKRATLFKTPIADTDFVLTCKGGAGAGTFSWDFAIGIDRDRDPLDTAGELWRIGLDTEKAENSEGRSMRIIRTGSGVRQQDPLKAEKLKEFKKKFKIAPSRALTFLSLYLAHSLGAENVKALTTEGAKNLSSLSNSKAPFDYSRLFIDAGFEEKLNPNWFIIPNLAENFYSTLTTTSNQGHGLRGYEARGMHEIWLAFQNLQNQDGVSFPIKLEQDEVGEKSEKIIKTFRDIHSGWKRT